MSKANKEPEMTAKEIEDLINRKITSENKNALDALRKQQREELKDLRAKLAKKKRQEAAQMVDDIGNYFISKFDMEGRRNPKMQTADYLKWIDTLVNFYNQNHQQSQQNG